MSLKIGIIGLPNVGKSTLFNAIMGKQAALTAPYPFATIEPNVGVVDVPDERLTKLHQSLVKNPRSGVTPETPIVYSSIQFVDIAGLVKGAAEGNGLGNKFLNHIRDVDLILHVLRDFEAGDVPRHQDSVNPTHDAEIVEMELGLKDLEVKEKAEKSKSPTAYSLLLDKPVIYAVNVGEDRLAETINKGLALPGQGQALSDKTVLFFSAKIEEEIAQLPKNEQKEFMKVYGMETSGLDRIITECFHRLGLISFLTAGKIEVKAWPIKKGSTAPPSSRHNSF